MNLTAGNAKDFIFHASMRSRLQLVTRTLHEEAERHFSLSRTWNRNSYGALLVRLLGFYAPLEAALSVLNWRGLSVSMAARRKVPWLEADLQFLGIEAPSYPPLEICRNLPGIADVHDGLGALYVLEGATLGGQVILRTLQPQLGISPLAGGAFFAGHGKETGKMWRSYLDALEVAGQSPQAADCIQHAALETFRAFNQWIGREIAA